jgi:hypothetical protein
MSTQPATERLELLQGTLDLLILRTLILGSQHGQGIARAIQQRRMKSCWSSTERFIQRCNGWRSAAGFPRNGESPQIPGRPAFIH